MNKITVIAVILVIILILITFTQTKTKEQFENEIVTELDNFLLAEECDTIINLANPHLFESRVYGGANDLLEMDARQSKQAWLNNNQHPIIKKISTKAAELTKMPIENQELLQVVRYNPGGFFNPHYDACDGEPEFCKRMNEGKGPRYATLLIYLNDNYQGGETEFPMLHKKVVPKKGKAVLFLNTDKKGTILRKSLHGGNKVIDGDKWICNKWVRLK